MYNSANPNYGSYDSNFIHIHGMIISMNRNSDDIGDWTLGVWNGF